MNRFAFPDTIKGILLGVGGVLLLSPDAAVIKILDAEVAQIVFWKSLWTLLYLLLLVKAFEPDGISGYFVRKGKAGFWFGMGYTVSNFSFILAVHYNPVANVLALICVSPLVTGIISYFMLGETLGKDTFIALLFSMFGILILLYDDLSGFENALALLLIVPVLLVFPLQLVLVRKSGAGGRMYPCMAYGAAFSVLISGFWTERWASSTDFWIMTFHGIVISGVSFSMIFSAPRFVSATWTNMFLLLETVFGTFLAWYFAGERVTAFTVVGSSVVVTTMFAYFFGKIRNAPAKKRTTEPEGEPTRPSANPNDKP